MIGRHRVSQLRTGKSGYGFRWDCQTCRRAGGAPTQADAEASRLRHQTTGQ